MSWWQVAMGGVMLGSGILAEQRGRQAGRANARLIQTETNEQLRRMDRQFRFNLGTARATYGARGVMLSGSAQNILSEMESEFRRQRSWAQEVGRQRARIARRSGQYLGAPQAIQGLGQLGAGLIGVTAQPQQSQT